MSLHVCGIQCESLRAKVTGKTVYCVQVRFVVVSGKPVEK